MFNTQLKIGQTVRPVKNAIENITDDSLGKVVQLKKSGRSMVDFYVTIHWDNGVVSYLNAVFFQKCVVLVNEVSL
ncbi:hypothetical protein [Methylomonas sp. AM2-LC]|uniref:hypothetical protein n=1 Tax=Methylomonas sp. AM2-LC TaxID=3153301 RepID=UPI0032677741